MYEFNYILVPKKRGYFNSGELHLVINYSNKVNHKMGKFIQTSFYVANFLEFNMCAHQYVVK